MPNNATAHITRLLEQGASHEGIEKYWRRWCGWVRGFGVVIDKRLGEVGNGAARLDCLDYPVIIGGTRSAAPRIRVNAK